MSADSHPEPSTSTYSGWSRSCWTAGLLASVIVMMMLAAATSLATPFVDVSAVWSIGLRGSLPTGVDLTCSGDATGGGTGCGEITALNTSVTPVPGATIAIHLPGSGGITIANISGGALTGFLDLLADYSAFNPGGPEVGLGIDNPITQAASFSSSLSLVDTFDPSVFEVLGVIQDFHSCSIGFLGESGTVFTPTTCGVSVPDSSQVEIIVDLSAIGNGSSASLSFSKEVNATFTFAAPEPPSLWLLLVSLSAMALPVMRVLRK